MERRKLTETEIAEALTALPGWSLREGRLHRALRFPSFVEAFGFMTQTALIAERLDHHPDWRNVYDTVLIDLYTHDRDGVTEFDLELARRIDALVDAEG